MLRPAGSAALVGLLVLATGGWQRSSLAQTTPTATDLAARVQSRYATVRDFMADFTQTLTSALLTRPRTERGHMKIKKPDRMRWDYSTSDKQVWVADGSRYYWYVPKDRIVEEGRLPTTAESSTPMMFLAGRVDLAKDFVPSVPAKQPGATEWQLVLSPKASRADFKSISVDVDRATYAIRGFGWTDPEGTVTAFRFTSIRENQRLPDSDFAFAIPRGVEIRRP